MGYLTAKSKEMRDFVVGKKIAGWRVENGIEIMTFSDGTYVKFVPEVDIKREHSSISWSASICANPFQKDGKCSYKKMIKKTQKKMTKLRKIMEDF